MNLPPPLRGGGGGGGGVQLLKMHSASPDDVRRARRLRTNMTDAEQHLLTRIRANEIHGYAFRRQVPLGPDVVDFACVKARLVIELDGSQHAKALERDQRRTAWLASQEFRLLR